MADFMDLYRIAVENSFEDNFEKYKDKSIIIYGTGDVARFIMDKYSDYNIIGFLDGNKTYGTFRGKRIFSYEEAVAQKPDIIIVAAKKNHIKEIYDRICYMCYTHNIQLYSIDGRNLFTAFGYGGLTAEQESYEELNEAMLKDEILNHDIICFEVFDVLLIRKTLLKNDLFEIVDDRLKKKGINIPGYSIIRYECETEAAVKGGNIYDIYNMMAVRTGIDSDIARIALETELAVENNILCCRETMKEMLSFAADRGKKIYLISNTYLPSDVLREMLDKHGITQFDGMLLSSECKAAETQGLYGIIKSASEGKSCLCITASSNEKDYYHDKNIDVFSIACPYDMLLMSSYRNLKYSMDSVNERSMSGLLSARLFSDPFALHKKEGRPEISNIYDFGYTFIAPSIAKYVLWIIEKVKEGQYEDVLFAARDGLIIHKLYKMALHILDLKLPEGIYFQTSRNLCMNAGVKDENDIIWISSIPHAFSPESMLMQRFSLSAGDITKYDENKFMDVISYALHHKDIILEKASMVRSNYLKYMKSIGLKKHKKYAFVDFVSSGTCQLMLSRIVPFNIEGLYFCRYVINNDLREELSIKALFQNLMDPFIFCSYSFENYMFLETMMTSFSPSIVSMDEKGLPIYAEENRSDEELQYVADIHRAVEDYFEDFIKNFYISKYEINKHFADTILSFREQKYTYEHCSVFDNLFLFEDLGRGKIPVNRKVAGGS